MSRRPGHLVGELGLRTKTESQAKRVRKVLRAWDGPRDHATLKAVALLGLRLKGATVEGVVGAYKAGCRAEGEPPEVRAVMCERIAMMWLERERDM